jgi:hypothetical protein
MSARGFPGLQVPRPGGAGRVYRVRMEVPYYKPREVEIRFEGWARTPKVFVDGPNESPHRYPDGSLCIWYPRDPPEQRWVFSDGLLVLLNYIQAHLFREAWWRERGEWLGPEAPHGEPKEPVNEGEEERDLDRTDLRGS